MSETTTFNDPHEVNTYSTPLENIVFDIEDDCELVITDTPPSFASSLSLEQYRFFISPFNIGEFPSGPRGFTGEQGPAGEDGVGLPEVFIDGAPATLNFAPVVIDSQTVYQMQVTAS